MNIDVLPSGIWQTNTTILSRDQACLVVDPGYFPRELDAVVKRAREIGRAEAVVFTHGHWDHVMGHSAFPDAPVWASRVLQEMISGGDRRATEYLEQAREFDSRWYVPRPAGHRWPERLRGLSEGDVIEAAGIRMGALHLSGHSPDGLGLIAEEHGLLLVGDYLSPCEIPFIDDADAYRATLLRLIELLGSEVREVIPGHGARLDSNEAIGIARADLEYVNRLADAAERRDLDAARAIPLPRAADVAGMQDHHRDNYAKICRGSDL